ncbi:hypothetical protein [Spirillospora sp. NPDC029432]|uniref:hypothetical protein n=1 Tax=Spirillospora sp. NPDC029432 TaxID=3154599 RepID=UPI003457127D
MNREEHSNRMQKQREANGETFTGVLRRVGTRPLLAIKVLLVLITTAIIGIALFEPPYESVLTMLVGVPAVTWLIRRSQ